MNFEQILFQQHGASADYHSLGHRIITLSQTSLYKTNKNLTITINNSDE